MNKNDFLQINNLIYQIYTADTKTELKHRFLNGIRRVIRYSYSSIMDIEKKNDGIRLISPMCVPTEFASFESEYNHFEGIDHTDWIVGCSDSTVIRESSLISDTERLSTPIYEQFYKEYDIYDTLQMSIVYANNPLAVVTLYRTQADGAFTEDDAFLLREIGRHLNLCFYRLYSEPEPIENNLSQKFRFTRREAEIVKLIFDGNDNYAIADKIGISVHTLQKHLQHIYRKANITGKPELLQLYNRLK